MDQTMVGYIGFVVAALILIWAAVELARRYNRKKISAKDLHTWVKLEAAPQESVEVEEPSLTSEDEDEEETPQQSLRARAKQNGHYSESKKPL